MEKRNSLFLQAGSLFVLGVLLVFILHFFLENPTYYQLGAYTAEEDGFRAMAFGENLPALAALSRETGNSLGTVAAPFMVEQEYDLTSRKQKYFTERRFRTLSKDIGARKEIELAKLSAAYDTLLSDAVYFPIPAGDSEASKNYGYEDSWGSERSYGGERRHEGTDLMDGGNGRGFFPVVSVSDGVVEHTGWLELGGWRLGIRSPGGAYFYYAHLNSYDHEFEPGEKVYAGQLLGFMGDTGYSKVEGTTGNFAVHLHFGIYFRTDHYEELSVNPYWVLRYLEEKKVKYSY